MLRDIRVADGTLGMLRDNAELKDQTISIRIAGIDAPEVSSVPHPHKPTSLTVVLFDFDDPRRPHTLADRLKRTRKNP